MSSLKLVLDILLSSSLLIAFLMFVVWLSNKFDIDCGSSVSPAPAPRIPDWLPEETRSYYCRYAEALMACVDYYHSQIGLRRSGPIDQHICKDKEAFTFDVYKGRIFHYCFDRDVDISAGGVIKNHREGQAFYSTFPVEEMKKQLNLTISNYCITRGLVPFCIDDVNDKGDGRVEITMIKNCKGW